MMVVARGDDVAGNLFGNEVEEGLRRREEGDGQEGRHGLSDAQRP